MKQFKQFTMVLNGLIFSLHEKIIYQSQEIKSHIKVAYELLEKGFAYKCYLNSEELTQIRIKSRENGSPIKSPWRDKLTIIMMKALLLD